MRTPERGATLVEAIFVLPLLLFLLLAVIEVGGMLKSYSGAASSVRVGSRAASVAGSDPLADQAILEQMAELSGALDAGEIELVVVWHAAESGDDVPAGCLPASTSTPNHVSIGDEGVGVDAMGACNTYVQPDAPGGAFAMARGDAAEPEDHYFGCTGPADPEASHRLDCSWPAATRQVLTSPRGSLVPRSTDLVGVYIRVRHGSYTGVMGPGVTITDRSITLIEPQGYALS